MNRLKKPFSLLLVFLMLAALVPSVVFAKDVSGSQVESKVESQVESQTKTETKTYIVEDLKLELTIPADALILTQDTSLTDPIWKEAGIENPSKSIEEYKSVGVEAEIVTADQKNHVRIIKGVTEKTESVYTFNDYSKEDLDAYFQQLAETDSEYVTMTCEAFPHEQTTFFKLDTHAVPGKNETDFREIVWGTIINGYTAGFSLYAEDGNITDEQIAFAENMVKESRFTEVLPRPQVEVSQTELIIAAVAVLGIMTLMIGFVCWSILRRKRMKEEAQVYAEQITNFRMAQKIDNKERDHEVSALFVNHTEHNEQAIMQFARYQAYWHHPFNIVYYIAISLAGLIICLVSSDTWWVLLLMLGVFGYCIYYVVTLPSKIGGRIREVFRKLPNKTAAFTFFDNEFRLSGIQSPALYPYAQITEAREYKDYFYLYFGEQVTYYLHKDQFDLGTADEFARFLRGKIGKRFKGYKESKRSGK